VDERQIRLLVVLSAMVIVVGLLYALVPRRTGELPWDEAATVPIWSFQTDQVVELAVTVADGPTARVRRDERGWQLVEPEQRPADPRRIEGVLRALAQIELGVPIVESSAPDLGLGEPPRGRVQVVLRSGRSLSLALGDEAPVGWRTYARAPDDSLVAISGHLADDVLLPPTSFRKGDVLSYPLASVAAAELHSPAGSLRVARDGSGEWWVEGWGRADLRAVDNLFVSLLDLRVASFADHLVQGDLDDPRHRVVVELIDGERVEARFGDTLPMGRLVRTSSGDFGLVPPEFLALLDQGPSDLLDRHAFPLRRDGVDRVEVSIDGQRATLEGGQGSWRAAGLSPAGAQRLFEALDRAGTELPPREPLAELGPISGRARIHSGGDKVRLIELGAVEGGMRRIRDASGGPITTLAEPQITRIKDQMPAP